MARPYRCRRIGRMPEYWRFRAENSLNEEYINMSLDEYEVIRLIDKEGYTQEECASSLGVGRTTVTAIYDNARKKLAAMIIDGYPIRITGGAYKLTSDSDKEIEKKGNNSMRIAITYEHGMVGQHFGRTEEFKLYDVEDGKIVREQVISSNGMGHGMLAGVLLQAEADVLICGGIGMGARMALEEIGIELLPGVSGEADEVIKAYLSSSLEYNPDETCHHHDHEEGHECHHDEDCGCHCHA